MNSAPWYTRKHKLCIKTRELNGSAEEKIYLGCYTYVMIHKPLYLVRSYNERVNVHIYTIYTHISHTQLDTYIKRSVLITIVSRDLYTS